MAAKSHQAGADPGRPDPVRRASTDLVIFDFDGVIADSEVISLSTLRETMARYGLDLSVEEVRRRYLGVASDKAIRDVAANRPERTADGFRETWHDTLFRRFRSELAPVSGLHDLLGEIEALGLPYCIASSSSFQRIGVALEAMRMTERFRHVFSAELVKNGKPAPDLFLHAARQLRTDPERCLVIEDSPFGVRAAKAAGMRAIGFLGGSHLSSIRDDHRVTLIEAGADIVLEDLSEVASEIVSG